MKKISLLLAAIMLLSMCSVPALATDAAAQQIEIEARAKEIIEVDGLQFKDLNGNGSLDLYEDWRADVEDRITDLMQQMTLEEKIGQLYHNFVNGQFTPLYPLTDEVLYSEDYYVDIDGVLYSSLTYDITQNNITHFAYSTAGTAKEQQDAINAIQEIGESARLGIPISISTDRPYNTFGSMVNMPYYAFGTAHSTQLLYDAVAQYTKEMRAMGYTTMFHGYGVEIGSWYGDEVNNIAEMIVAEIKAYEENGLNSMTKHYIARGGRNSFANARSDAQLWENWMVGWDAAVNEGGVSAIMMNNGTGFSNTPILYDSETIGYLRNELGFDGVLCTDWPLFMNNPFETGMNTTGFTNDGQDLSQMTIGELYTRMLECGIDQFGGFLIAQGSDTAVYTATGGMNLYNWPDALQECVENGTCPEEWIDRSVRRILRNKFNLGLFEDPYGDWEELLNMFGSEAYIAEQFEINSVDDIVLARNDAMNELDIRIMTESTVLMKNDNDILPLKEGVTAYVASNDEEIAALDQEAIGAYATVVDNAAQADVVIVHTTALDEAYTAVIDEAKAADKPVILVLESANSFGGAGVEPGADEVANCAAILMQTYNSTPDHGTPLPGFYHYVYPSVTADMLFGLREPTGSLVFEIARTDEDVAMAWGDLQLDTGVDDATRLYLAQLIRNTPDVLIPNNLGDVLYTTNFGLRYGQDADFEFNTLLVPRETVEVEEQAYGGQEVTVTNTVLKAQDKVQAAGVPFEIMFIAQNNGADGYFTADVYSADELVASKFMALDGGQFRIVTIELTLDAGTHEISVCGLTKTIVVE